jgi:hypothetical protein
MKLLIQCTLNRGLCSKSDLEKAYKKIKWPLIYQLFKLNGFSDFEIGLWKQLQEEKIQ